MSLIIPCQASSVNKSDEIKLLSSQYNDTENLIISDPGQDFCWQFLMLCVQCQTAWHHPLTHSDDQPFIQTQGSMDQKYHL